MAKTNVRRGGRQLALYLFDDKFTLDDGTEVIVSKSNIPSASAGMQDVIVRHKARYGLVALFCRPGKRLLDFPCGSGYPSILFSELEIIYEGRDFDRATVEYARRHYRNQHTSFLVDDLRSPNLEENRYNVIGCIEGLEHIEQQAQQPLIESLHAALQPGGTLVVSSPEAPGKSGPSDTNPEHLWELTRDDFVGMLVGQFGMPNVEVVSQRNIVLTTGVKHTCLYGVCHKAI